MLTRKVLALDHQCSIKYAYYKLGNHDEAAQGSFQGEVQNICLTLLEQVKAQLQSLSGS